MLVMIDFLLNLLFYHLFTWFKFRCGRGSQTGNHNSYWSTTKTLYCLGGIRFRTWKLTMVSWH